MNIKELERKATQGELWIDDDGFIAAGRDDTYTTFADLDVSIVYAVDIDEREANKKLLIHKWNKFNGLLEKLKSVGESRYNIIDALKRTGHDTPIWHEWFDEIEKLIEDAENVP
jgi:hypothetical protein